MATMVALCGITHVQAQAVARPSSVSAPAPPVAARVACSALVQDGGGRRDPAVRDFQEVPGAPTRVTSAAIVPATATQPEHCLVTGYVQPQVTFELKLPTATWQGRYVQFGCGGYCGVVSRPTFPACGADLGGDFAIAATNDGHDTAQATDALWAGLDEQARIDYGYRGVHVVSLAAKAIQEAYYGRPPPGRTGSVAPMADEKG